MTSATYIYENIEHGSIEKLIKGIQKIFTFLFSELTLRLYFVKKTGTDSVEPI